MKALELRKPEKNIGKSFTLLLCFIASGVFAQFVSPFSNIVDSEGILVHDTITRHIYFDASGGGDALFFQSLSAAGRVQAKFKITEGFDGMMGVDVGGTILKNENSDSVPLSSIYFPEAASTSFIGAVEAKFFRIGSNFSIWVRGDLSLEQRDIVDNNSMDSTVHNFTIINYDAGLKFKWEYPKEKAVISESFLYEQIEIDDNTGNNFDVVFGDNPAKKQLPTLFRGFCTITQLSVHDIGIYLRTFSDGGNTTNLSYMVGVTLTINLQHDACPCN